MSEEFTPQELKAISVIRKAGKFIPDEMWAIEMVQEFACLYAKCERILSLEDKATFIGIGGYISNIAEKETSALFQAKAAIENARNGK